MNPALADHPARINILHFAKFVCRNDFVDSVVCNLDPRFFNVHVVTFEDTRLSFTPVFKEKEISHINLGIANARNIFKILPELSKIISKYKIDIIHAHLFEEQFIGAFLKIFHPKIKFIIGRHYSDEIYLLHAGIKRKAWLSFEGFANSWADKIIAGSGMVVDLLLKQRVPAAKIVHIPYGFDFNDHQYQKITTAQSQALRAKHGIKDSDLMLVNVGRLFNLKGQILLIDVFAELCSEYNNLKLLIIGDGPDRNMLEQKMKDYGLENKIEFTGWLKNAYTYISAADIVVHPTLSEMFSQLMIEAMALGRPLVINNVSGVPDVITHKLNGLICNHEKQNWKESLAYLIENPEARSEIGAAAEKHVKKQYPISGIIKRYESLYQSLV
jgi:glycosyltransferase involved in cell wall biosynthesis